MIISESKVRNIIAEELKDIYSRELATSGPDTRPKSRGTGKRYGRIGAGRIGTDDRAGQGDNIDFMLAMVEAFDNISIPELRRALCRSRGIDPRNLGQFWGYFSGPFPAARRWLDTSDRQHVRSTSDGHDRWLDSYAPQSAPGAEELQEEMSEFRD